MELFYPGLFACLSVAAGALQMSSKQAELKSSTLSSTRDFLKFRNNYLIVYTLMMAGDWLQGPYVYELYNHYGFNRGDIGRLFIAGFASSLVFGTLVGALADKTGRKKAALTYVVTYSLGCVTKHFANFGVLLLGRVLCGIATSLLYSAFESWLVAEHFKRGFDGELLGGIFSRAVFLGNGIAAIASGLLAHSLVQTAGLGPVAPFDAAIIVMAVGGVLVAGSWTENYGDAGPRGKFGEQLRAAALAIYNDPRIALLGAMQSLFEGSMYTFVFLWTPALSPKGEQIPHGMVFATFMLACMVGSSLAGRLLASPRYRVERFMQVVFGVAAASLAVPVAFHQLHSDSVVPLEQPQGISWAGQVQLGAFCCFEACVGVFWPAMMAQRAEHVPEAQRATIINIFRIPLNLFVCVVLYHVNAVPLGAMFAMCAAFLLVALLCQRALDGIVTRDRGAGLADHNADLLLPAKRMREKSH